ncbi:hypothetical protein C8J57DRAFT_1082177, partial [Mycena rebaudengoi]
MIQNLKVNQRDPPKLHKPLVRCINRYGMEFATVHPPATILREMPLWYHPGEDPDKRQENNGRKTSCLRKNHAALKVGDGMDLAQRLSNPLHGPRATCGCDECDEDRETGGCENPHACAVAAAARLGQILPKWIPRIEEGEATTELIANQEDRSGLFRPPERIVSLAQGLRVMTLRTDEPRERPDPRTRRRAAQVAQPPEATVIYIAGAVHAPPRRTTCAAAGIFIAEDDSRNKGKCLPSNGERSQYIAEFYAALEAIRSVSKETALTVVS